MCLIIYTVVSSTEDPEVMSSVMIKKAYNMLGINENEKPEVVKERIHEQLLEEAEKLGAKLDKDAQPQDIMREMDKVLTKQLNEMLGLKSDSLMPSHLKKAALDKLTSAGIPVSKYSAQ